MTTAQTTTRRKRLFVDRHVQGELFRRLLGYWVCCMLFVTVPLFIGRSLTEPDRIFLDHAVEVWEMYWPLFAWMCLLLPLVLFDLLRLSNRIVGPLFRMKREFRQIAAGGELRHLQFRESDFWADLASDFNVVVDRAHGNRAQGDDVQGDDVQGDRVQGDRAQDIAFGKTPSPAADSAAGDPIPPHINAV